MIQLLLLLVAQDATFTADVELVNLLATVTDRGGRIIKPKSDAPARPGNRWQIFRSIEIAID
jgi:hypothetical protein